MPLPGTETDRSGSIASGGDAQDVYTAAQQPQNGLFFQNISDTSMTIAFGEDATATNGRVLAPGAAYENPLSHVPSGRLSVFCASTGKAFVCKTV
jgi:hypothetical protein